MPSQPLIEEIDYRDPAAALAALPLEPGLVFLDSAQPHPELGRWSWLAADPFAHFTVADGVAYWNGEPLSGHPSHVLRRQLTRFSHQSSDPDLAFCGVATGIFAYEAGRLFERLPEPKRRDGRPEVDLWFHDVGIAFDAVERRAFLISSGWPEEDAARRGRRAHLRLEAFRERLTRARPARAEKPIVIPRERWQPNMSPDAFKAVVERTRAYIAAGDIFQANLTQAWRADLPPEFDPLTLYAQLRRANPAPFGGLLLMPDRLVASTSPEGFLLLQGGRAETRPIKGTRRRSLDPVEDRRLAEELVASEKDRAENVMIVDLMRNDFSRACRPGTVQVPVLCGLESYASVHHLVSVVRGHLKPGFDALHLLAACFPGGSITGAPKIRAMQVIHELEPEPRGVYCGSIVHFGYDGSLSSNIAIRTLIVEDGVARIHAGGGITLLSDPEEEYVETLVKAERIFAAFDPVIERKGQRRRRPPG
jgi:para-aminobenzoate synthetase component 1